MGKFDNVFEGAGGNTGEESTGGSQYTKDDYKAFEERVVAACGTQAKKKSVSGYISGIIWLGKQPLPPAQVPFTGSEEEERQLIAEKPNTFFKTEFDYQSKKDVRYKCWPQPSRNAIAITVDFPKFQVEGVDGVKRPVRMLLNGKFIPKGGKATDAILNRVYDLRYTKDKDGEWTLNHKGLPYKLAVATEVINEGDVLTDADLGKLIGRYAQFEMRAFMKDNGYFEERVSFKGTVPEEVAEIGLPEVDESTLYFIRFDKENDKDALKVLRSNVINQMTKAEDWETSVVKTELEAIKPWLKKETSQEPQGSSQSNDSSAPSDDTPKAPEEATGGDMEASEGGSPQGTNPTDDKDLDIPF